jgi:hypothetical protein
VRRISAPLKRSANGSVAGERFITTVVGAAKKQTIYAASAAECFRFALRDPVALCLMPSAPLWPGRRRGGGREGCSVPVRGLHGWSAFVRFGARQTQTFCNQRQTGLCDGFTLDEGGTRLFALTEQGGVSCVDLRSGVLTELIAKGGLDQLCAGSSGAHLWIGAVYDADTRSLIVCDTDQRLVRIRGVC